MPFTYTHIACLLDSSWFSQRGVKFRLLPIMLAAATDVATRPIFPKRFLKFTQPVLPCALLCCCPVLSCASVLFSAVLCSPLLSSAFCSPLLSYVSCALCALLSSALLSCALLCVLWLNENLLSTSCFSIFARLQLVLPTGGEI